MTAKSLERMTRFDAIDMIRNHLKSGETLKNAEGRDYRSWRKADMLEYIAQVMGISTVDVTFKRYKYPAQRKGTSSWRATHSTREDYLSFINVMLNGDRLTDNNGIDYTLWSTNKLRLFAKKTYEESDKETTDLLANSYADTTYPTPDYMFDEEVPEDDTPLRQSDVAFMNYYS